MLFKIQAEIDLRVILSYLDTHLIEPKLFFSVSERIMSSEALDVKFLKLILAY